MYFRKRLGAGFLAVMMAISSMQLPGSLSRAEELTADGIADAQEIPAQMETAKDGIEASQDLPGEEGEPVDSESGADDKTGEEYREMTDTDQAGNTDQAEDTDQVGSVSASETEELSDAEREDSAEESGEADDVSESEETALKEQISGNDTGISETMEEEITAENAAETFVEGEWDGVYQFGGAPSAESGVSATMSVSPYTSGAETYIYQQLKARQTTVDVSAYNINGDSLKSLVVGVLNEHPDLYFVERSWSYSLSGGIVMSITFTMDNTLDDAAVQSGVNEALSAVETSMSDLEKAIALHDYLVVNCEYDQENYEGGTIPSESYSIYGVFAKRVAVCQGYALAYKYLLNQVGIDCYMVNSDDMNHAWNMIVLDGKYYQVDVTWDDPTRDQIGRAVHTYMFCSDTAFDGHYNWQVTSGSDVVNYIAGDTKYDSAFWKDCRSPLVITGDDCYYICYSDRTIRKKSLADGADITASGTSLRTIDYWPAWGGSGYYSMAYSGLFLAGGRLYYNDYCSICSMNLDGTDRRTEFNADISTGYIYGSAYCQGEVRYALHQSPKLTAKEQVLVADITISGGGSSEVAVESVSLNQNTLELAVGEEEKLYATIFPAGASGAAVSWSSSDTAVATVDESGTVRAVLAGSCTITAAAGGKSANCHVTVTEISDSALNLINPEIQFTALDDTKISSKANGKPKILVFYSNGCRNCQTSISSIRDSIGDFGGADIYAIEISKGTKESVSQFQEQYGCSEITFSYDTGSTNSSSMWNYLRSSGFSGSTAATPVICYIDAANKFQYITQSISTADTILSNLKKYCNYSQTQASYTITYVLGGGTNHADNPATYTSETEEIVLKDASREGYRFDGWYEDAAYQKKITSIQKGRTGNIILYAKWTAVTSYTITYVLGDGTNHVDNPATYTESDEIVLKDAARGGYRFDGWYEDAAYQKKITVIQKGRTGNITLYAKWSEASSGNELPKVTIEPSNDAIVVRFKGEYDTDSADKLLDAINKIREEAWDSKNDEFEPLKWSADMEAIARLRAAETSVKYDKDYGPNGVFYKEIITNNGIHSDRGWLAYSERNLLNEINSYHSETLENLKRYVPEILDPQYHYVGAGCFKLSDGTASSDGTYRIVMEFSRTKSGLDERKDSSRGTCEQDMEIAVTAVKNLQFVQPGDSTVEIRKGDSYQLSLQVVVKGEDKNHDDADYTGTYQAGGTWSSSNEAVAVVDDKGMVTARSGGTTTIAFAAGGNTASVEVKVPGEIGNGMNVALKNSGCTYNGFEQRPKVTVTAADAVLQEDVDYTLSYRNNINAGIATVTVTGIQNYSGSVSRDFEIKPAQLVIRAKDKAILKRASIPSSGQYGYETVGLCANDTLSRMPSFSCGIESTSEAGQYEIIPYDADAGANYEIAYESGWLRVADELVSHIVSFDMQGHGEEVEDYFGIRTGATIEKPTDPLEVGYRFGGWFKDAACTKAWDFDTDTVQSDVTLYAGWLDTGSNGSLALREITDMYYTGKALKPVVNVYDGDTLLKAGRDYQVKYHNNVNANEGNAKKTGNGQGNNFKETLPYVEIIGKGNYTETLKVNFNILKAVIGDGASAGAVVKVSDQLVQANKAQKPFQSIKYRKAMKAGKDFTLSLKPVNARDESGQTLRPGVELKDAQIPANYEGEFQLSIQGTGNYEGTIRRTILVADKKYMLKNARITLGKNLKNISYTDEVKLMPSEESSPDTFTVKCGKTVLKPGTDYVARYDRHPKPGKAALTIVGINGYVGSKTVTYNVKGKVFSPKTVEVTGIEDKIYTGSAQTQNGVILTYSGADGEKRRLTYGTDYTISYTGNVNKGNAVMIFKGKDAACFSGSLKKTFKITAADVSQAEQVTWKLQNSTFSYCRAGVKPTEELTLTNHRGVVLRIGKDYTLKYSNNKAVARASDSKPPTVTVMGRGNYTGKLDVHFTISEASLSKDNVKAVPLLFQSGKADTYIYKPRIKVMDGRAVLREGKDYEVEYRNNTQKDCERYIQTWRNGSVAGASTPQVVISSAEGSDYRIVSPIVIPLPVYQHKMTKSNLDVQIREVVYTGGQARPEVQVYYVDENNRKLLLQKDRDYLIDFGANIKSGRNKGTVRISGIAPSYGGDVTVKFEIQKKPITGKEFH